MMIVVRASRPHMQAGRLHHKTDLEPCGAGETPATRFPGSFFRAGVSAAYRNIQGSDLYVWTQHKSLGCLVVRPSRLHMFHFQRHARGVHHKHYPET